MEGRVKLGEQSDLLVGLDTNFLNELEIGMPIILGSINDSQPDSSLPTLKILGFQSRNNFSGASAEDFSETEYALYTYGTKIVVQGG